MTGPRALSEQGIGQVSGAARPASGRSRLFTAAAREQQIFMAQEMLRKPEMKLLANFYSINNCEIGEGTIVRDFVNLYGCKIGAECKIAAYVEIQRGVTIGDRCKVEAFAFIPTGVTIGDEVFIGPHVVFTNDLYPRAVGDWEIVPTNVKRGASIGAGAVIVCGITIGENALVGAGAVVTRDVPPGAVVVGNPAREIKRK